MAYLKEREQFGVPIGTFQALQRRAADMFAEVELCRACMILAALHADSDDDEIRVREISAAKAQLTAALKIAEAGDLKEERKRLRRKLERL